MKKMRIAGIGPIVVGVIIIIAAIVMKNMAEKKSSEMVDAYMRYIEMNYTEESTEEATDIVQTVESSENDNKQIELPENMLGIVNIDKIGLSAPLAEGTDNKSIMYALGHFKNTAMPGEMGNFAVAGHRSYTFGEYFSRLDELERGDRIEVLYNGKRYNYEVTNCFVVEPEQTEVLNSTDKPVITLVTCTPKWTATHRLIVRGELKEAADE